MAKKINCPFFDLKTGKRCGAETSSKEGFCKKHRDRIALGAKIPWLRTGITVALLLIMAYLINLNEYPDIQDYKFGIRFQNGTEDTAETDYDILHAYIDYNSSIKSGTISVSFEDVSCETTHIHIQHPNGVIINDIRFYNESDNSELQEVECKPNTIDHEYYHCTTDLGKYGEDILIAKINFSGEIIPNADFSFEGRGGREIGSLEMSLNEYGYRCKEDCFALEEHDYESAYSFSHRDYAGYTTYLLRAYQPHKGFAFLLSSYNKAELDSKMYILPLAIAIVLAMFSDLEPIWSMLNYWFNVFVGRLPWSIVLVIVLLSIICFQIL